MHHLSGCLHYQFYLPLSIGSLLRCCGVCFLIIKSGSDVVVAIVVRQPPAPLSPFPPCSIWCIAIFCARPFSFYNSSWSWSRVDSSWDAAQLPPPSQGCENIFHSAFCINTTFCHLALLQSTLSPSQAFLIWQIQSLFICLPHALPHISLLPLPLLLLLPLLLQLQLLRNYASI